MTCPRCNGIHIATKIYKKPPKKEWELKMGYLDKLPFSIGCLLGIGELLVYVTYLMIRLGIGLILFIPKVIVSVYKSYKYGNVQIDNEHETVCSCVDCGFKWKI